MRGPAARSLSRGALAVTAVALAVGATAALPAPSPVAAAAPTATISRYMETAGLGAHYDLGCERSRRKVAGPIALIYGRPVLVGGVAGASIYAGPDATVGQIEQAAKQFVQGYRDCAINAPQVVLIVATTNDESNPERVTFAHGAAWSRLINAVAAWTVANGYAALVNVQGGNDMEPGFNQAGDTRAWVDGYDSANNRALYNLGSADGCPLAGDGRVNGACNNGWRQSDVLYVSWLAQPAVPLPQIYTNNAAQAKQWRYIKLYGVVTAGRTMTIQGSLTQWNACQERTCGADIDNTPAQGHEQLSTQLNADARTAQSVRWSTDMSWRK
jgi:hypothetical protein